MDHFQIPLQLHDALAFLMHMLLVVILSMIHTNQKLRVNTKYS